MTAKTSRRVAFAVVAFLIAATVATSSAPPVSAQAVPGIDWMQYNMYGRSGHLGKAPPANRVVAHVNFMTGRGDSPVAVSLQETCFRPNYSTPTQATIITTQLPSYTTAHHDLVFLDPATDPLCTRYGNMLLMLGPRTGPNGPTWGFGAVAPDFGEDRGVLCGRAHLFGWHTACTTHLTPPTQQAGGAQAQQASVVNIYNFFMTAYPGAGRYLGGDFNMTPSMMTFVSPNPYAFGLREADDCCNGPTFPHPGANKKYDYSFVSGSLYSSSTATVWSTAESDHLLLEGHFS